MPVCSRRSRHHRSVGTGSCTGWCQAVVSTAAAAAAADDDDDDNDWMTSVFQLTVTENTTELLDTSDTARSRNSLSTAHSEMMVRRSPYRTSSFRTSPDVPAACRSRVGSMR